jgi:hypothetical protein
LALPCGVDVLLHAIARHNTPSPHIHIHHLHLVAVAGEGFMPKTQCGAGRRGRVVPAWHDHRNILRSVLPSLVVTIITTRGVGIQMGATCTVASESDARTAVAPFASKSEISNASIFTHCWRGFKTITIRYTQCICWRTCDEYASK